MMNDPKMAQNMGQLSGNPAIGSMMQVLAGAPHLNPTQLVSYPAPNKYSLVEDTGRLADTLLELHNRLQKAIDALGGAAPTPISGHSEGKPADLSASVRRHLDSASGWVASISDQLNRLESLL